jgi:hypothetical protein
VTVTIAWLPGILCRKHTRLSDTHNGMLLTTVESLLGVEPLTQAKSTPPLVLAFRGPRSPPPSALHSRPRSGRLLHAVATVVPVPIAGVVTEGWMAHQFAVT